MSNAFPRWLARSAERLELRTYSLAVIEDVLAGFHDCSAELVIDGAAFRGRAQARSERLAVTKAAAEAIERWLVEHTSRLEGFRTSNGFAVHTTAGRALQGARRELVERDLYLCHVLTNTPFAAVDPAATKAHPDLVRFRATLRRQGVRVRLAWLPSETGLAVILCAAFGEGFEPSFGAVVGFGAHPNMSTAITKAVLECWMGLVPVLYQAPQPTVSRKALLRRRRIDIDAHAAFGLHEDGRDALLALFRRTPKIELPQRAPVAIARRTWARLPKPLADCPLVGARCESDALQGLFFGLPRTGVVNEARLVEFCANRGRRLGTIRSDSIHLLS